MISKREKRGEWIREGIIESERMRRMRERRSNTSSKKKEKVRDEKTIICIVFFFKQFRRPPQSNLFFKRKKITPLYCKFWLCLFIRYFSCCAYLFILINKSEKHNKKISSILSSFRQTKNFNYFHSNSFNYIGSISRPFFIFRILIFKNKI